MRGERVEHAAAGRALEAEVRVLMRVGCDGRWACGLQLLHCIKKTSKKRSNGFRCFEFVIPVACVFRTTCLQITYYPPYQEWVGPYQGFTGTECVYAITYFN